MPEHFATSALQRLWYGRRVPWWLRPLSAVFGLIVRLRRAAFRSGWLASNHPGVPVVVVGNLSVGGTGKTPFTLWLVEALRERGVRAGIATRGYGGTASGPVLVDEASTAGEVGDEALLLARRSGVVVCVARRRTMAARALVKAGCEVVIADDGLQHLALQRDLEIVVVDAARGFGNGALLPAGPLREPLSRLDGVDFIVVQGEPVPAVVAAGKRARVAHMSLQPLAALPLLAGPARTLEAFRGQSVHAVAGIGHPARFFQQLRDAGLQPVEHPFPDHHRFTVEDFAFGDARPVIMTEKDAVKCTALADARMWYLPVVAQVSQADAAPLLERVLGLLSRRGH